MPWEPIQSIFLTQKITLTAYLMNNMLKTSGNG